MVLIRITRSFVEEMRKWDEKKRREEEWKRGRRGTTRKKIGDSTESREGT